MKPRIVAEITRTWTGQNGDLKADILSQRFEKVIAVNAERGFELESWQMQSTMNNYNGPVLIETIVAVFIER